MTARRIIGLMALMSLALIPASVMAQDDAPLPAWSDLPTGEWTMIPAGGDTICSNGTPYAFYARPAETESDKLLIHFQGGGACWFGAICDLQSNPTYDPFVDETDDPTNYDGIFNFSNEDNPFRDYNMVFVPYCTGDVHVGNSETTYTVPGAEGAADREVTIQHNGYVNATTVLDWTYVNVEDPATIFVTGCSAGAIPTPLYTQFIAEAYPDARIEALADAAGSYRNPTLSPQIFGPWGTLSILPENYASETVESLTFEDFYAYTAAAHPDITLTQFNTANDEVQAGFLELSGVTGASLKELQDDNFADILATGENLDFHTYTAGGSAHCITPLPDFYTYTVDGMTFRDWVAALEAGETMTTVTCTECDTAEMIDMPEMAMTADAMATAEATSQP